MQADKPVIYNPQRIQVNGPIGLTAPRPKPKLRGGEKNKNEAEPLELIHVWLTPGLNFLSSADQWEPLMAHSSTKERIEHLIRRGALYPVPLPEVADGTILSGTSLDYTDLQDVKDMVLASNDVEWLRRCVAKDNRPDVDKWCFERIDEIEKLKKRVAQAS